MTLIVHDSEKMLLQYQVEVCEQEPQNGRRFSW